MSTFRLGLCNFTSVVRKAANVPVGAWYLAQLGEDSVVKHFRRTKALILAHRSIAVLYAPDFKSVDQIRVCCKQKDRNQIRKLAGSDKKRAAIGTQFLIWLPHHRTFALFSALSKGAKDVMNQYAAREGAIVSESGLDVGPCYLVGLTATTRAAQQIRYYVPACSNLTMAVAVEGLQDEGPELVTRFRRGDLIQEAFEPKILESAKS